MTVLRRTLPAATMLLFLSAFGTTTSAAPGQMQSAKNEAAPSRAQIRQLTLDVQLTSLKCEQKTKILAGQIFDSITAFRIQHKRFPQSVAEINEQAPQSAARELLPPANPFADPLLISKELSLELRKTGNQPPPLCNITIESDPYISAGFPLTLRNFRLKPATAEPGSIIVKFNGDYYLATWCMGLSGKPVVDEKTQLPFLLFKDFSSFEK